MSWDTGDKHNVAEACEWAETRKTCDIEITPKINSVIQRLCDEIKVEWQMMLCGKEDKTGVYINDYWIPKQEVAGASVTNLDIIDKAVIKQRKIVATIHSHANMGVFFSGTDVDCTNLSLIKNHIVVNNYGKMKAVMRYELPCGLTKFFDTTVRVKTIDAGELKDFENIIVTPVKTYPIGYSGMGAPVERWKGYRKYRKHAILDKDERRMVDEIGGY